tara:strand:+ start:194 stop:433 length:240 start_codon:yes stop_codon:yes gene_type:complete
LAATTNTCSGQATTPTKETLDLASNERKLLISKKGQRHAEKQPFGDHHALVRSLSDLKDGLSDVPTNEQHHLHPKVAGG